MKHVGILGHSWEGASLCWREVCQHSNRLGHPAHPDVTMDCISFEHCMPAWERGDYEAVRAMLATSVDRLARAGCDFFVCPDNTAHLALEAPGDPLTIPGLHLIDIVADAAQRAGHRRVGILGTRFTTIRTWYTRRSSTNWCTASSGTRPGRPSWTSSADSRSPGATRSRWCAPRSHFWSPRTTRRCRYWTRHDCPGRRPSRWHSEPATCRPGAADSSGDNRQVATAGRSIEHMVLFYEIALVIASVLIAWFAVYVLYRLVTDESTSRH